MHEGDDRQRAVGLARVIHLSGIRALEIRGAHGYAALVPGVVTHIRSGKIGVADRCTGEGDIVMYHLAGTGNVRRVRSADPFEHIEICGTVIKCSIIGPIRRFSWLMIRVKPAGVIISGETEPDRVHRHGSGNGSAAISPNFEAVGIASCGHVVSPAMIESMSGERRDAVEPIVAVMPGPAEVERHTISVSAKSVGVANRRA